MMNEQFGGYALLERIGVGGMAEVFLARRTGVAGFERDIAIKRIRPHLSEHRDFINMFLGEAKLAGSAHALQYRADLRFGAYPRLLLYRDGVCSGT